MPAAVLGWADIGIVTGLTAEAALASRLSPRVATGGGGHDGAVAAAERLLAAGARALVSFGVAGGLDPVLAPGALVVPAALWDEGEVFAAAPEVLAVLGGGTHARAAGGRAIVTTASEKAALFLRSGGVMVDLESAAVARVAAAHGVGFGVVRAICDPASRDLPPAAAEALDDAGAIGVLRVMGGVLRQPAQLGGLLRLGVDAAAARAALTRFIEGRVRPGGRALVRL